MKPKKYSYSLPKIVKLTGYFLEPGIYYVTIRLTDKTFNRKAIGPPRISPTLAALLRPEII